MRPHLSLQHDQLADAAVVAFEAKEGLSSCFELNATFLHPDPALDLKALLGTTALFLLEDFDQGIATRPFFGLIDQARYLGERQDQFLYRVRARPALQGLSQRVRSRIFQGMTAVEVIQKVLKDAGIPDDEVDWRLSGTYPPREFCVQYRESELAFVLRLLEDEGIFFWFEHSEGAHLLCFGDDPSCHPDLEGDPLPFTDRLQADREALSDLVQHRQLDHDLYFARDWNFLSASRPLQAEQHAPVSGAFERYEYPGCFQETTDGLRRCRARIEEAMARGWDVTAIANTWRLAAGSKVSVVDAWPDALNREYLIVSVEHQFAEPQSGGDDTPAYRARATFLPTDFPFRPPRRTPRPRINGRESAVVTGPPGEEIHVDEHGRIKVHLYWDREGKVDDKASCWMRVQQQNTSGSMILPRVGWEVDVAFLHGDPDRPVVLQKVYNRETMPPYALPDHKTQSALQSSSSPGGGGTNEVRLQDGNGGMEFFVHASKDLGVVAGNDMSEDIAVDAQEEVGLELKTHVGSNEEITVGASQSVSVTGDCTLETVGAKNVSVGGVDDWGIGGLASVTCDGSRTESIGGMMNVLANHVSENFNGNLTRTVGAALSINCATAIAETVGGSKTEPVGAAKLELIRKAKAENVAGSKVLNSGFMKLKSGKDIGCSAKAAMAITAAGAIAEKVSGGFNLAAKAVVITAPGGLKMSAGGSKFELSGGKVKVSASSLGGKGGPLLKLAGKINYK